MGNAFRDLLKKVAGGPHTSKDLSREEAAQALELMLTGDASAVQIGAFLIAHRMKRPTGIELAGMLDAYDRLGPRLPALDSGLAPLVLGCPYDGRVRTFPLVVITALILASAGCPVLLHGGDRMPTKYGVSLVELWQSLGVDWTGLPLDQVHGLLTQQHLGLVYLPRHFPLACTLINYRDDLGKRPPIATLELMWSPYGGQARMVVGYVHPPTETLILDALQARGTEQFWMVKGLEGSMDLPGDRPVIASHSHSHQSPQRIRLHPDEFHIRVKDIPFTSVPEWATQVQTLLTNPQAPEVSELLQTMTWNAGFYLWQSELAPSLEAGMAQAHDLLASGQVAHHLQSLRDRVTALG